MTSVLNATRRVATYLAFVALTVALLSVAGYGGEARVALTAVFAFAYAVIWWLNVP